MNQLTISELLRGCSLGRMQTSGLMQVLPLISDLEDDRLVSPVHAGRMKTTNYGVMNFTNDSEKTMLIPSNATYLVKQKSQDHSMAGAGLVKGRGRAVYENAMCVQETQGGYISESNYQMTLLPFALREASYNVRDETYQCGKLWGNISSLLNETRSGRGGHLHQFMDAFEKELDQFVAEFECLPKQVGAIVLINGTVVGIERAPSYQYFKDLWQPLIRECYGSEAVRVSIEGKKKESIVNDVRSVSSLLDLKEALVEARSKDEDDARGIVRDLLTLPFKVSMDAVAKEFKLSSVEQDQFVGQVVQEDAQVHYVSIISKRTWNSNSKWSKANAFTL